MRHLHRTSGERVNKTRLFDRCGSDRKGSSVGVICPGDGRAARDEIAAVVASVAPKPVNLLVGWASDLSVADISALGVRRISIGGALARAAWGGFMRAARLIAEEGRFDGFAQAAAGNELNAFFAADLDARSK